MSTDFQERARRLRNAVEPVAAGVYFAPEAHEAYAALGFAGSPVTQDGVARPELKSYCTSRGACMGQVAGPKRIAGVYYTGGGPHFGSGLTIDTAAELHAKKA